MQMVRLITFAVAALTTPLWVSTASDAAPLPATSLELTCRGPVSDDERKSFTDFMDFAEQHDGEPVFVSVVIEADSGAGGCARNARQQTGLTFRSCANASDNWLCGRRDKLLLEMVGPPLPYAHGIILPGERTLPVSLPYSYYGYGNWLSYSGPFIVRYFTGTGFAYATLDVPDPALDEVWSRAHENSLAVNRMRQAERQEQ